MDLQEQLRCAAGFLRSRRFTEAQLICQQILAQQPACADAKFLLAGAFHGQGKFSDAVALLRQCAELMPDRLEVRLNLGDALMQSGALEESEQVLRRAVAQWPASADLCNNLGNVLLRRGQDLLAVEQLQRAVELAPGVFQTWYNLGRALQKTGRAADAAGAYQRGIALAPNAPQLHYNLGVVQQELGDAAGAEASYRRALALKSDYLMALNNLGLVLMEQRRYGEAIEALRRAVSLKSDYAAGWTNLGNAYGKIAQVADAVECHRKAIALTDSPRIHSSLVFAMHYHPAVSAEELDQELRAWDAAHARRLAPTTPAYRNEPDPDRPLRIGYVSSDLSSHVVGRNVLPVFLNHDLEQYAIYAYSSSRVADEFTSRLKSRCAQWREISELDDDQAAELIQRDQIDILVDLNLQTSGHRLLVSARRPAPVQMAFAGYPGSTGLSAIDYRIGDPVIDPPGLFASAEKVLRLPHSFWCFVPDEDVPEVSALPADAAGRVTFGCLNNPCKVNETTVELWAGVLRAVADSRMIILTAGLLHMERIRSVFARGGISSERLEFLEYLPRQEYLRTYGRIDIALDTLPYNGHTTTLDALWMGVPVVSVVGGTTVGRAGLSQMSNLGTRELVAEDGDAFTRLAAKLAADRERLRRMRAGLRQQMRASPLMDAVAFTRGLEALYRQAWKTWCGNSTGAASGRAT